MTPLTLTDCPVARRTGAFFWNFFMARVYYGLATPRHLRDIVIAVCNVLGHGAPANCAVDLMLETAAQETHCGQIADPTPNGAGRGLFQIDPIAFNDICQRARPNDVNLISQNFGINIRTVRHDALDHSPLLSAIFCRLFYKLLPAPIPATLVERAAYWKKYYNTELGAGTVGQYVNNASLYASMC